MPHIPHTLKGINNIYARTAELPRGRAHARQPRTTLCPLLPSLYFFVPCGECRTGRAQARHPRTTLCPLLPTLYLGKSSTDARQNCRAGRAHARHPRTALSSLLPTLYFGSPLHSDHALPSPPFSLLSTFSYRAANAARGALKRANHALPSPPFSLLSTFHSNISPCKEEAVGVEDSGLTWGDGVDALWERGGDPSTGEWSERAGDRRLDRTRL